MIINFMETQSMEKRQIPRSTNLPDSQALRRHGHAGAVGGPVRPKLRGHGRRDAGDAGAFRRKLTFTVAVLVFRVATLFRAMLLFSGTVYWHFSTVYQYKIGLIIIVPD